jgi:hypothetical protein
MLRRGFSPWDTIYDFGRRPGDLKRLIPMLPLAILLVAAAIPAFSQVAPAATRDGLPLTLGVGVSDYNYDFGSGGRMVGVSAWADWDLYVLPGKPHNLSIQVEGNALDFGRPAKVPIMRQDTGLVGVKYRLLHDRNILTYVKYVCGIGSIDFTNDINPNYKHDDFAVWAPGGGIEIREWRQLWLRVDYEYQFWHHTFGPHDLTPQGFTIGGSYHFRPPSAH